MSAETLQWAQFTLGALLLLLGLGIPMVMVALGKEMRSKAPFLAGTTAGALFIAAAIAGWGSVWSVVITIAVVALLVIGA